MDCSLPGSSVHGIFQARVLEWVAIAFSVLQPRYPFFFFFYEHIFRKEEGIMAKALSSTT